MPWAPKKPCAEPGCPKLATKSRCPDHEQTKRRTYERARGSSHDRGYGRQWRKLRLVVLREEPLCREHKKKGRIVLATDVDHIKPKAEGGTDDRSNLQPLCHSCHSVKTAREHGFGRPGDMKDARFRTPVTVVCGPPGSGKSTHVDGHKQPGDLVVDIDALYVALTGLEL